MAAIVNARDTLLQAAQVRLITDAVILMSAKPAIIKEVQALLAEQPGIDALVAANAPLRITYDNAIAALNTYLTSLVPPWNNLAADTPYDGPTYRGKFLDVYAARQALLNSVNTPGLSNAVVFAYKRSATAPTDNPGAVTYTFASASITTPAANALGNGWSKTIPTGSDPLYVVAAPAAAKTTTVDITAAQWSAPVLLAKDGLNSANVLVYQRTNSSVPPAAPTATTTYTFSTGALANLNGGWSRAIPTVGGIYLWVTSAAAAATGATDDIAPGEWAAVSLMAKDGANGNNGIDGTNGTNGVRGSKTFYVPGYSSWNDAAATSAASVGGGPVYTDTVVEYNSGNPGWSQMRMWDGSAWLIISQVFDGNVLVRGTLGADAFIANAFTGYLFTGSVFQTAASGPRIVLNSGNNNMMQVYSESGLQCEIGGSSGVIWATSGSSLSSTVSGTSTGILYGGSFANTGSGPGLYAKGGSAALHTDGPVTSVAYAETANKSVQTNNCIPIQDNTYNLGTFARRWMGIVSATAVVVSSDTRLKDNIADCDLGLEFINSLRPVSYTLRVGRNDISHAEEPCGPWLPGSEPAPEVIVTEVAGTRTHYGFLAPDVKRALGERNAAMWLLEDKDNPDSYQALRYEELIAPHIRATQQLNDHVTSLANALLELGAQVQSLTNEVNQLKQPPNA